MVIDPSFGGQEGPSEIVSVDNAGDVLTNQVMQVGVDSRGRTWRTEVFLPPITPPSRVVEPGDGEPWVLSGADFLAHCPLDPSTQSILCVDLENVTLLGMATPPPPSYSSFAGLTPEFGTVLYQSPPNELVGVVGNDSSTQGNATMMTYMHGQKNGWWFGITGDENVNHVVDFDPGNTSISYFYVQQPPPTYVTAPTGLVTTPTPTLTAAPVTDVTDTPIYDFQISTSPTGIGTIVDSGWLDNQTSWTVPQGSLQDGTTYYATVRDAISQQEDTTDSSYVPPAAPVQRTSFTVREHLGSGGPSPADTIGSPPQGASAPSQGAPSPGAATASETVNMVTGNMSVAVELAGDERAGRDGRGDAGLQLDVRVACPGQRLRADRPVLRRGRHPYLRQRAGRAAHRPGRQPELGLQPAGQRAEPGAGVHRPVDRGDQLAGRHLGAGRADHRRNARVPQGL